MGKLITALKWFAYGIALGLLAAPRSGRETRQRLMQTGKEYFNRAYTAGKSAADDAMNRTYRFGGNPPAAGADVHEARQFNGSATLDGGPA